MSSQPTADRSVRLAWAADAGRMATVQRNALRQQYAEILPATVLSELDAAPLVDVWEAALRRPPSARHRILVALDRSVVVGFVALTPSEDPDADSLREAELVAFHIDPDSTSQGHGSRLIAAAVDTARADRFDYLTTWVFAADDAVRGFLEAGGWAADGAHREIADDDGSAAVRQIRLHTALNDAAPNDTAPNVAGAS